MVLKRKFLFLLDLVSILISSICYYYYYIPVLIYCCWCDGINILRNVWTKYSIFMINHMGRSYEKRREGQAVAIARSGINYKLLIILSAIFVITILFDIYSIKRFNRKKILPIITWIIFLVAIGMVAFIEIYGAATIIEYYYED